MTTLEQFKELVFKEFEDAAADEGGNIIDKDECKAVYINKADGTWYQIMKANYARDLAAGKDPANVDSIAHFESQYYLCARIAGKRAAKKAAGGHITARDFDKALNYVHRMMQRAMASDLAAVPNLNLCG